MLNEQNCGKSPTPAERRKPERLPPFGQGGRHYNNYREYKLYRSPEDFEKAYGSEYYRQTLNDKSLEPVRASILAKDSECRQRDENEFIDILNETQTSDGMKVETKLGNCLCKSAWCSKCHKLYYVPKYKNYIQKFDFTKTRHVILTADRCKFIFGLNALKTITEKKSLSAFIRKLRKGKKIKVGKNWEWQYPPVKIKHVLAVLEFHKDGFPHWHLLIEVENKGKAGMIGGENIHRCWPHGIVKETYFKDSDHWKNIAGYFADKGYFEKGKEYQTELPQDIREHYGKRVRRITYYPGQKEGVHEEERIDVSEEEAFREVTEYFEAKKQEHNKDDDSQEENKKPFSYETVLSKCGQSTYVKTVVNRRLIELFVPVPFKAIRDLIKPVYVKGRGYICSLTIEALRLLEANSVRIIEHREECFCLFDDDIDEDEDNDQGI